MKNYYTIIREDSLGKYVLCCWLYSDIREWMKVQGREYKIWDRQYSRRHIAVTYKKEKYDFFLYSTARDEYCIQSSIGMQIAECVSDCFEIPFHSIRSAKNITSKEIKDNPIEILFHISSGNTYWRVMRPSEFLKQDFTLTHATLEENQFWAYYSTTNKMLKDATPEDLRNMMRRYIMIKNGLYHDKESALQRMYKIKKKYYETM